MRPRSHELLALCVLLACGAGCDARWEEILAKYENRIGRWRTSHDTALALRAGTSGLGTLPSSRSSDAEIRPPSQLADAGPCVATTTLPTPSSAAPAAPRPSRLSPTTLAHPALAAMQRLVDELGPEPWTRETWDPYGFADIGPDGRVFMTEDGKGNVLPQPEGRKGLNCLGAFTEALRAAYDPDLRIDDIEPCIREPRPRRCAPSSTGARALKYARMLLASRYEVGHVRRQNVLPGGSLQAVPDFPVLGLCVVSHTSAVHQERRYFHHMIIASRLETGLYVLFDATAANGLRLAEVSALKLRAYVRDDLAHNAKLGLRKESAKLSCVPVGDALPGTKVAMRFGSTAP